MRKQRKEHKFLLLRGPAEVEAADVAVIKNAQSGPLGSAYLATILGTKCFPVKLLFQKFHVHLRAPQGTLMIPKSSWVSLPPLFWGLGTSVAISDGQVKDTGFCHVLRVRLYNTGIILWLLMLLH